MVKLRKKIIFVLVSVLLAAVLSLYGQAKYNLAVNAAVKSDDPIYQTTLKRDILCLMMAYPGYIQDLEVDSVGKTYVVLKSGKKIIYDDFKEKNVWQKSGNPDIQDMLEQIYPLSEIKELLPEYYNPGCARIYPLFKEVYGTNKSQIEKNLVKVSIGYKFVEFNKNNHAAAALQAVMKELLPLARKDYKVYNAAFPSNGTYYYRLIGGTNRLSSHAFGIAIDLHSNKYDYWRWSSREQGQKRLDNYPQSIVRIFEKNGFIWGGKWGNFDIMHYEYRPEIIYKARYFAQKPVPGLPWYDGLQNNQEAMNIVWWIEQQLPF